jgi:hypothetical protein
MHSFHQSRGRVFFEVLCALAVSASCVGTWMQTGAPAPLAAAAATLLYGLVHLFDMRRPRPAVAKLATVEAVPVQPVRDIVVADRVEVAEPAAPAERKARQPKAPKKTSRRRASAANAVEPTPVMAVETPEPVPVVEASAPEPERVEEPTTVWPLAVEETAHAAPAPLFEPEPFVRQQRAFGRKAG